MYYITMLYSFFLFFFYSFISICFHRAFRDCRYVYNGFCFCCCFHSYVMHVSVVFVRQPNSLNMARNNSNNNNKNKNKNKDESNNNNENSRKILICV